MTDRFFHDLDTFVAAPRIAGLAMSHDGQRLVASVQSLDAKRTGYITSLWELDGSGVNAARQLTRGTTSDSIAAFTADGEVLFIAKRTVPPAAPNAGESATSDHDDGESKQPDSAGSDEDAAALWLLPHSGEARCVLTRAAGIGPVTVARESGSTVVAAPTLATTDSDDLIRDDTSMRERSSSKVSAILHDSYPVRYWDHDLGPASARLFVAEPVAPATVVGGNERLELRDLTGHVSGAFGDEAGMDITGDGSVVVTDWAVAERRASTRAAVMRIDTATGERLLIADDPNREYEAPQISPDGSMVAMVHAERSTPERSPDVGLSLVSIDGGDIRTIADDWDLWPSSPRWTPDGTRLVVSVDENGRGPLYVVDATTGERRRLTNDDGTYMSHQVSPDGTTVYALRTTVGAPPQPVRIDFDTGEIATIPSPVASPELPGALVEVTAAADDGTPIHSWLALPHNASADPAPLLLWIHGGPLASWNAWSWRWNPWTAVARGYAVLLPDPALSTGYGRDFIDRGWGAWGDAPYTDLMAVTDAAVARDDIDETRTAAMGGSFGGYMANWVAGHTDRFDAIVTHASLWALDQFGPTTDAAYFWAREMTEARAQANSPHRHVDKITTPTLVVHGDRDYRVPIGEGLRLWYELVRESADDDGNTPHRFLYFPDENHWILSPNNAQAWYSTIFAFLSQHVLGNEWEQPDQLML